MDIQKVAERVAGYSTATAVSVVIDDLLWPVVMLWQGSVWGGVIMFLIALLANLVMIWAYDKIKKDLFCFEDLRALAENEQATRGMRLLAWFVRAGKVPAFLAISFYDPFISVLYMRRGAGKYQMENRDWGYFMLAMFIACTGWTACWGGAILTGKTIWGLL